MHELINKVEEIDLACQLEHVFRHRSVAKCLRAVKINSCSVFNTAELLAP